MACLALKDDHAENRGLAAAFMSFSQWVSVRPNSFAVHLTILPFEVT